MANRLATSEKKEGEGRTGTALVAQRHPVNSAASKRLTVVPWRRSILEIQPYTIRSRVHGAAAAPHRATTLHSASFRFAPAAPFLPTFLATRTEQDPSHAHVSQTLHGPRQSVKRGVNNKPWEGGAGIRGSRSYYARSFSLSKRGRMRGSN